MSLTKEDIQALREPFPVELHSVREGPANKDKTKCMWFVYLDRHAIAERLDDLFPGEWDFTMTEPIKRDSHFSSVGRLAIRGIVREFNGAQEIGTDNWSKAWDDEKGCGTDTFRRAASMWGIGAYLSKAPDTWTPKPDKKNRDAQNTAKAEVLKRLETWLSNTYNNDHLVSNSEQQSEQSIAIMWPSEETVAWVLDKFRKQELSDIEILKLAGVTAFDDGDGWRKYEDAPSAVLHIQAAFDAQLIGIGSDETSPDPAGADDGSTDEPDNTSESHNATFHWKRYFVGDSGGQKYLELATEKPGTDVPTAIVRAYGRSTTFKKMIGDTLYTDNALDKYDDKKRSQPWSKLNVPLDLVWNETGYYNTVIEANIPF